MSQLCLLDCVLYQIHVYMYAMPIRSDNCMHYENMPMQIYIYIDF